MAVCFLTGLSASSFVGLGTSLGMGGLGGGASSSKPASVMTVVLREDGSN